MLEEGVEKRMGDEQAYYGQGGECAAFSRRSSGMGMDKQGMRTVLYERARLRQERCN